MPDDDSDRSSNGDDVRHVVGTMTGTSMDGIDVAMARITGHGLDIKPELVRVVSGSLGLLAPQLRAAAAQEPMTAGDLATLAWEFGRIHGDLISEIVDEDHPVDLIAVHGQTVFHDPPISWQLLNPAPIAQQFKVPVVSALRQADLAAGGEGAPLSPLADWVLFRDKGKKRAVINFGGFCNMTVLPRDSGNSCITEIDGFDVCSCNLMLNAIARLGFDQPYDKGGSAAIAGTLVEELCTSIYQTLIAQREGDRSLGTGDEVLDWVDESLRKFNPNDVAASAVMGIAMCVGHELSQCGAEEAIVAGGSVRNKALMAALTKATDVPIKTSDKLSIPSNMREAYGMACLGALCADGVPISLPQVTGCTEPPPVSGLWAMPYGWE